MRRCNTPCRISASAGPPPPPQSYQQKAQLAANNGQPLPLGAGIGQETVFYFSGDQSNPSGCVRAPYDQWYPSQSSCIQGIEEGYVCNPRYINGAWDRFVPYARDTVACNGSLPPDILPQILDSMSLIDTELFQYTKDPQLSLNMNGYIGELTFTFADPLSDKEELVSIQWSQSDNLSSTLYNPVAYYYAVPYEDGVARLAINSLNGHATITMPFQGFLGRLQFQMTNIMPWDSSTMRAGSSAKFAQAAQAAQ